MSVLRFLFILFALQITTFLFSQNVIIEGQAINQPEKLVRIQVFADQFSSLQKTLATTTTDKNGFFKLELDINHTDFAFLALNLEKNQFYLSPKSNYKFTIPEDTASSQGSIFDKTPLYFELKTDNKIQEIIEEYNFELNNFIYQNANHIYKSKSSKVVTDFGEGMLEKYSNVPKYANEYITYSIGSLYWLSRKLSNKKIVEGYFINKPVLYNNIQYTEFFTDFFKSYFSSEKTFRYEDMVFAINRSNSVSSLDELICRDSLLATNKQIREIIEMDIMFRNYFNRDVVQEKVDEKLKEISQKSEYPENREIAKNYLTKLYQMKPGTKAPLLQLTDGTKNFTLDDFQGKFILLNFITDNCAICYYQVLQLDEIMKTSHIKFDIITVFNGNKYSEAQAFAKSNNIDWPVLLLTDILNLESYNIATFPSYVLINPDGTVAYANLPNPQENMELYIQRFMEKYNQENK